MTDRKYDSTTTTTTTDTSSTETEKSPRKPEPAEELKSRTFRIPSHCDTVMQALNRQKNSGEYCDITVLVEHQRFSAHKCILAANSPYFKSLLINDNDGVFLRNVTADSFAAILDYMYTSRLHLESSTVQDVLTAAKFLQIKGAVSICCRYLESQIRVLARDIDKKKLSKSLLPAMISVEPDLYKGASFPSLSPLQQQPQLSYNPETGMFESDQRINPQLKPVVVTSDLNQQAVMVPYQSVRSQPVAFQQPMQIQNPTQTFPNSISQKFAVRARNVNPTHYIANGIPVITSNTNYRKPLPAQHIGVNKPPNMHQVAYPGVPQTIAPMATQNLAQNLSVANSSYLPSFYPCEPKTNHFQANASNPFPYAPNFNQQVVQPNYHGGSIYTSPSAGGKGRRQHVPIRRKGGHGTVSAETQSLKFTFSSAKPLCFTSSSQKHRNEVENAPIMLLSCARETRSAGKEKKPATAEKVFAVEAEDRYWDALSSKSRTEQ